LGDPRCLQRSPAALTWHPEIIDGSGVGAARDESAVERPRQRGGRAAPPATRIVEDQSSLAHKISAHIYLFLRRQANRVFKLYLGRSNRPAFFDIDHTRPELRKLDQSFDVIRRELDEQLVGRTDIPRYHEVDPAQYQISHGEQDWRVLMLLNHNAGSPPIDDSICPATRALLAEIPDCVGAFFSILDPAKEIPRHSGPYVGYLRYHLALEVPGENPPTISVGGQSYTWKTGESVVFDDTWYHEVSNKAKTIRVVLVVDFLRPMPWVLDKMNRFVSWIGSASVLRPVVKWL